MAREKYGLVSSALQMSPPQVTWNCVNPAPPFCMSNEYVLGKRLRSFSGKWENSCQQASLLKFSQDQPLVQKCIYYFTHRPRPLVFFGEIVRGYSDVTNLHLADCTPEALEAMEEGTEPVHASD